MLTPEDEVFLRRAIALAHAARAAGDAPYGSLLVGPDGEVLAEERNTVRSDGDISAHPELKLARWAAHTLPAAITAAATMYTSCQPCGTCTGAIDRAGLAQVVYALSSDQAAALDPFRSASSCRKRGIRPARYSSTTPSTIVTLARPRTERARAWSACCPSRSTGRRPGGPTARQSSVRSAPWTRRTRHRAPEVVGRCRRARHGSALFDDARAAVSRATGRTSSWTEADLSSLAPSCSLNSNIDAYSDLVRLPHRMDCRALFVSRGLCGQAKRTKLAIGFRDRSDGMTASIFSHFCFTFHDRDARLEHMVDSLSVRERELHDAIAAAQIAENLAAARKASAIREFALERAASLTSVEDVEPEKVERKIVAEVAVACRVAPSQGRRRLHLARDLHCGLDHVRGLFGAGELSEASVLTVVAATAHLDPDERAAVDDRLSAESIERLGVRRVHDLTTRLAMEIAPDKAEAKARAARCGRHVRVRLASDGMADLVAHLPAEQAAACFGALHKAVKDHYVTGESVIRSRGQILADTLVERVTGQATARDVTVEVQILMPVEALLDPDSTLPAQIAGHGPVPAQTARDLLATTAGKKTLRRLVTRDGIVIGGDSRRRTFDGTLEALIRVRDGNRCTAPYCDALIRHIDHKERWSDGGLTEFTNGDGLCEFHNHAREPLSSAPCTPRSSRSRAKSSSGSTRPQSRAGSSRPDRAHPTPVG